MYFDKDLIQLFTLFTSFLTVAVGVSFMFFSLNKSSKKSNYDEINNKIQLDMLRHNLEAKIYELNERLNKNPEKFMELNSLQIDGTQKNINQNKILLNSFLNSAGINESDLIEKDFVFILTPFHKKFDEAYNTIKKVCDSTDIRCIRGDEQNFKGDIFSHVLLNIVQAKLIIANISGRNPNVMYELGLAHALDKNVILVAETLQDIPVDLKSKRIVTYTNTQELEKNLPLELLKIIR